ncbi:asparaginase domain-containing protein [Streptomyces sp. S399]|uniref:asparaginase domain-containing protein n=1 Tax=Streptomyces sp. S399 TaxID=3096009 RepID=UPI002A7EFD08|nr:asparaginase domain-containing protein [Streptomyces sp. S399]WPR53725.1 asparaginase domain-containing protein [Streptomyces sp. S399]
MCRDAGRGRARGTPLPPVRCVARLLPGPGRARARGCHVPHGPPGTEGPPMATVALLATGGTIASTGGADGRVPTASGRDLLRQAGLGGGDPPVPVRELELGGSFSWDLERMRRVIEEIRGCLAAPVRGTDGARPDGVVVTHGTDTMEETVFLASLLLDDPRPVVLTGAQQPYDSRSPDGPENLRDAFAVAAAPSARGRGPLLCFDGLVFAARGVTKVDTLSHRAFGAPAGARCCASTTAG